MGEYKNYSKNANECYALIRKLENALHDHEQEFIEADCDPSLKSDLAILAVRLKDVLDAFEVKL